MRRSMLLGIPLLLWLNCASAFAAQVSAVKQPLELTVEVVSQQYCAVNSKLTFLQMSLKLHYLNTGTRKLILYKGHDLFYQAKIRTAGISAAKPYEVTLLNSRYFDEDPEPIEQSSPGKAFAILSPGATLEREMVIGIGVTDQDADRGVQAIGDGEHTLQLIVSTWYKSKSLAQKLRQQWERKGLLWFDAINSQPTRFAVERSDAHEPCK